MCLRVSVSPSNSKTSWPYGQLCNHNTHFLYCVFSDALLSKNAVYLAMRRSRVYSLHVGPSRERVDAAAHQNARCWSSTWLQASYLITQSATARRKWDNSDTANTLLSRHAGSITTGLLWHQDSHRQSANCWPHTSEVISRVRNGEPGMRGWRCAKTEMPGHKSAFF